MVKKTMLTQLEEWGHVVDYIQKAGKNYYFHKIITKIRCAVIESPSQN